MSTAQIKAIPTEYNGTQYKSRLEARFAEWMDKHEINHDYEKIHIAHDKYLPDFVCLFKPEGGKNNHIILIEIKPIVFSGELEIAIDAILSSKNDPFARNWMAVFESGRDDWKVSACIWERKLRFFSAYECLCRPLNFHAGRLIFN